jgi:hypothetical protein
VWLEHPRLADDVARTRLGALGFAAGGWADRLAPEVRRVRLRPGASDRQQLGLALDELLHSLARDTSNGPNLGERHPRLARGDHRRSEVGARVRETVFGCIDAADGCLEPVRCLCAPAGVHRRWLVSLAILTIGNATHEGGHSGSTFIVTTTPVTRP